MYPYEVPGTASGRTPVPVPHGAGGSAGDMGHIYGPKQPLYQSSSQQIPTSQSQQAQQQQQSRIQQVQEQQQQFRIPYTEPHVDPFISSLDPARYNDTRASVTSLRDRFRVTTAIAFSIFFHWFAIYVITFLSNLWNFGSIGLKPALSLAQIWHGIIISTCAGLMAFLHFLQIQWSKPYSVQQINNEVVVYLRISTILYFFSYLVSGVLLATAYQGLYNGGFTKELECSGTEGCLNDKYLFILFASLFSLGKLFANFRSSYQYRPEFPDIVQSLHGRIRYFCAIYFGESSKFVLRNVPSIYLIYYFMGATFRIWASHSTSLNLGVNLLQSFWQFLSIELFLYLLITTSLTVGTFKVSWEFMYLCLTKRRIFPLDVDPTVDLGDGAGSVLLTDALRTPESDYMRVLAFYDVYCMTDRAERRVQDLFRVGYKGDRTLLWTSILEECLKPLKNTSAVIKDFLKAEASQKQQKSASAKKSDGSGLPKSPSANVTLLPNLGDDHSTAASLNVRRRGAYPMRPLGSSQTPRVEVKHVPMTPVEVLLRGSFRRDKVQSALSNLVRSFRWTGFYFNKKLEAQILMVMADSQIMIMSLRVLMNVVKLYLTQSFADIVQRDLATIIVTLIETCEAIELLAKVEKRRCPTFGSGLIIEDPKSLTVIGSNAQLHQTQAYLSTSLLNALLELDCHFRPFVEFMPISFDLQTKFKNIVSSNNFMSHGHAKSSK